MIVTDAAGCKQGKAFTISNSCLGLAKTISSTPVNNGDGSYTLTYSVKVENRGTTLLSNIQVTENLSNTFVGATAFSVNSVVCNDFAVNPSFDGTTQTSLLAAPLGSLVPNQITNIQVTVTVTPGAKLGVYDNSASGTSTDPNGTSVDDISQDGTDVDPDSDGPGDNSVPTPVSFTENPKIGIAKAVTEGPTSNGDGSYDLTYTLVVSNDGDVPLKEVQVTDNLTSTFGSVPLSVLSITSPTLAVNSSYDGTSNTNMLAGTDVLAVRGTATIVLTIRVSPAGFGAYDNTAIANGKSPANTAVTDSSQNGALTDPDADGDPTDNNVQTPVSFTENPSIGLAKALSADPINNQDGTYTVTYDFILRNTGDVPVKNLQVFDTLSVTFPGKTVVVNSVTTSANLTASTTYTGAGSNTGLLSGTNTLAVGESGTISLTITITPGTNLGVYNNSATANGNGPLGTPVSDISNDGADVDPENDGASDNSIPTPVSFTESPQVGIAKAVNTPTSNGDGTYNATYTLKVSNTGDVPFLTNIQVTDNLATTFSTAASFEVVSVSASGTLTANTSYNGSSDQNLLVASSSTLATGQTETITIVVKVRPGANLGVYNNNANVTATSPGGAVVTDTSTDGSEVDPDDNSDPGDNSVPTPLSFVEDPKIGVAKRVSVGPTSNGNGTYNLSYDIRVQNLGDVALSDVQVIEDLSVTYFDATSFTFLSASITTQPASSTLALNGSYNGSTNVDLLTGMGTLQPGEFAIIRVNITVNPGLFVGPYENTATAYGTSPAGTTVVDDSEDGANVDPNSDGDANDNDTPTPVNFTLITISGKVFNDVDGLTDNLIDGAGTNAGVLYVNLVNPSTGAVIASIPVNSDGTYTFTPSNGVQANTSYSIILTAAEQTVGATLTAATLPTGWTTTGENSGTGTGSDGTANSILSVTTGTTNVTDVNFGIEQLPTAGSGEYTTLNPGGTVKVTVPPSTFTNDTPSSDIAPGTVTSIRITAFPSNATTITINGITYTSSTFPAEGVIVPTDASGNPTQAISVDPTSNGETTVIIPFKAIDNAGKESENTGNAVINFTTILITGTVFNDADGLTDSNVDGTGTNAGGLYANLVDPVTNEVIASVEVNSDGTYNFTAADGVLPNTNYDIILTTTPQTAGQVLTTASLPSGWVSTGEDCCDNAGSDGTVNSKLSVSTGTTGVTNANFGIEQLPTAGSGEYTTLNPGGTTEVTVPASTFTNDTPSSDIAPGTVTSIRITAFPSNATTITINGITYTSSTFPAEGVIVPTDASGNPTQAISVDPTSNGETTVIIPFKAIDNAGKESENTGNAVINFTTILITGTVFNDADGLTDSNVDGTGTNAGGLYANLVDPVTNEVIASVAVNSDGTYSFTAADGVLPNTNYDIILTTTPQTAGQVLTAASLPSGWVSTGEDCCDNAGSDGTVNSKLSVSTGTTGVTNANFGIEQLPTAGSGEYTTLNPGGTTEVAVPASTFTNDTPSSDIAPGTVTSIRITAFPSNATTITINGITYTSSTFPAEGVIVPTDASGNPTQTISVDPELEGETTIIIPFKAIDNAGKESVNTGTAVINLTTVLITGNVFNDVDGLTDGNVDGTGTNAGGLYANLVDPVTNEVIASVAVNSDGTYTFTDADGVQPDTDYNIILTTSQQIPGRILTTASLPSGWVSTGEDCCDNAGDDGAVNGKLSVSTGTTGVTNANFGIQQPPTAGSGSYTTFNPGGTTSVTVPASTFTNITPSSDIAPGTVTSIRITAFPSNATSITINGITYTSSTFPAGGVIVPTDASGNPTQTISVDPTSNGSTTVIIPFKAIDNAGTESANTGTAVINFSPIVITGTVFNDVDLLTDNNVDGIGTNAGGLYANLVDPVSNQVIASVPVNSDGTYAFTVENGVLPNTSYNIILTTTQQTAGQLLTVATLPTEWASSGEDCCDNSGHDGTVNSILFVSVGTESVSNANFGIYLAITLPVSGLEISGILKDQVAAIRWSTLQEINSDYFEVERSLDNVNFIPVGKVKAAGNSDGKRQYNFNDQLSLLSNSNVFYYRIKQVDSDGKYIYSKTVVLRRQPIEITRVMPNPFIGELKVMVQVERSVNAEFSIVDAHGKVIYANMKPLMKGQNIVTISGLDFLSQGAYLLKVNTGTAIETIPVIKTVY